MRILGGAAEAGFRIRDPLLDACDDRPDLREIAGGEVVFEFVEDQLHGRAMLPDQYGNVVQTPHGQMTRSDRECGAQGYGRDQPRE